MANQLCICLAVALAFLHGRVDAQPTGAEEPSPEAVASLISKLGAKHFPTRQRASDELETLGEGAVPMLRTAETGKYDLETRRRIEQVIQRIEAAKIEKLLRAYCARHELARDKVKVWDCSLAPAGRLFRYKLPAHPAASDKEVAFADRYAFVFVDPSTGNVYDVKHVRGGYRELDQRTFAVLRLMGTKVADRNHAERIVADFVTLHWMVNDLRTNEPVMVGLDQARKGENWAEPAVTYSGHAAHCHVTMTVDDDGHVTSLRLRNIR